jgi:hypothetical protein
MILHDNMTVFLKERRPARKVSAAVWIQSGLGLGHYCFHEATRTMRHGTVYITAQDWAAQA